jgi:replicative DNA helicase
VIEPIEYLATEQAVVGGMLRWPDAVGEIVSFLRADDFRADCHQRIFRAVVALWDAGKPVDVVGVANELQARGEIEDIGRYAYLGELVEKQPTSAGAVFHARKVRERSVIRQLHDAAQEIAASTALHADSAERLLEEAERKIFGIADAGYSGGAARLDEAVNRLFDLIDERARRGDKLAGVATGFPDLDEMTGGLEDGEVTILAARTSVGKTSLALQITRHAAVDRGLPALFVSLEMSESEIVQRLLCGVARVDGRRLRTGKPSRDDGERLMEVRRRASKAPLFIDDRPQQRLLSIAATARRLKRQEGLRLLVIDYVQLVEPEDRKLPRHEQVSGVSRRLKGLAKDLGIPVLALAQLSRAAEEGDRPRLHHLRESGSLEQDSDVVLLMHRSEDSPAAIEIDVAKNRNGPTGVVKLAFHKQFTRFENFMDAPPPGE